MTLPNLANPAAMALFLDFDGTLVAIADRPDNVVLEPATREALLALKDLLDGAVAIVTGRDIAVIDAFLAPLELPIAGVHGATRRDANGNIHLPPRNGALETAIEAGVAPLLAEHPGLLLERKHGSLALHYRAHPELEAQCQDAMQNAVNSLDDVMLKRGKMVIEAKSVAGDKGTAIAAFMAEAPFDGRTPLFAGDDVTDEDAFRAVNAMGGVTIKIGPGPTEASFRAADRTGFLSWLNVLLKRLAQGAASRDLRRGARKPRDD
jgi:trehalose 6-phosphate phosphatase